MREVYEFSGEQIIFAKSALSHKEKEQLLNHLQGLKLGALPQMMPQRVSLITRRPWPPTKTSISSLHWLACRATRMDHQRLTIEYLMAVCLCVWHHFLERGLSLASYHLRQRAPSFNPSLYTYRELSTLLSAQKTLF